MADGKQPRASDIKCSHAFWTYGVKMPTSLLAQRNISALAEWDTRLKGAAKKVLDFMLDWQHDDYGDSLSSVRLITNHLQGRAPIGCNISKRTVQDGLACLIAAGWAVCTHKGTSRRDASRYIIPPNVLANAAAGKLPENRTEHTVQLEATETVRDAPYSTVRDATYGSGQTVRDAPYKDTSTRHAYEEACTCSDIDIPQATPAAEGGVLAEGFDLLAKAYAKAGDNLAKAKPAFLDINPDEAELGRMVKAAESWRASAKGARMSLERWLKEKRWLSTDEFKQDNRPSHRWPSCTVTKIKGGDESFKVWFRDRDGAPRMQVLSDSEYGSFQEACSIDRPVCNDPSDDLHEFVGVRFQLDEEGYFEPYMKDAA